MARFLALPIVLLLLPGAAPLRAQEPAQPEQDVVTLTNGNRLTGTVKSFDEGVLVFTSEILGDVEVPAEDIADLVTATPVELRTTEGETYQRRIESWQDGRLILSGEGRLALGLLEAINPPPEEEPEWRGSVNIGASYFDGNTERRAVAASAEAIRRSEIDRISVEFDWDYAEDKDPTVPGSDFQLRQRRTRAFSQYDYFISEKAYLLANTEVLGDTLADIDLRFTAGVGFGYQWVETDTVEFNTELGANYVDEDYRSAAPGEEYVAARAAYGLLWNITEGVSLKQDVTALPSLEDGDDLTVSKATALQVSLTDSMFTEFKWELGFDNTPSPGRERIDNRFFATLGWSF